MYPGLLHVSQSQAGLRAALAAFPELRLRLRPAAAHSLLPGRTDVAIKERWSGALSGTQPSTAPKAAPAAARPKPKLKLTEDKFERGATLAKSVTERPSAAPNLNFAAPDAHGLVEGFLPMRLPSAPSPRPRQTARAPAAPVVLDYPDVS